MKIWDLFKKNVFGFFEYQRDFVILGSWAFA